MEKAGLLLTLSKGQRPKVKHLPGSSDLRYMMFETEMASIFLMNLRLWVSCWSSAGKRVAQLPSSILDCRFGVEGRLDILRSKVKGQRSSVKFEGQQALGFLLSSFGGSPLSDYLFVKLFVCDFGKISENFSPDRLAVRTHIS